MDHLAFLHVHIIAVMHNHVAQRKHSNGFCGIHDAIGYASRRISVGDTQLQHILGGLLLFGKGFSKDPDRAQVFYEEARLSDRRSAGSEDDLFGSRCKTIRARSRIPKRPSDIRIAIRTGLPSGLHETGLPSGLPSRVLGKQCGC